MYYSMTDIDTKSPLSLGRIVNVIYIPQKYRKLRADRLTNLSLDAHSILNIFYTKFNVLFPAIKLNKCLTQLGIKSYENCLTKKKCHTIICVVSAISKIKFKSLFLLEEKKKEQVEKRTSKKS